MLNSAIKLDTPSEWRKYETKMAETNITGKLLHGSIMPKRQGIQHRKAPVTPGLRPGYDLSATEKLVNRRKNVRLVAEVVRLVAEVAGDRKGQISRSKVVVMFKTQSYRAFTTRLRPTCDRKMLQSWANRRKNVRLATEVVRLVAEVVVDRKGQISRNRVDGHLLIHLREAFSTRTSVRDQI